MPELPDIQVYREALEERVLGQVLEAVQIRSLFVLRSVEPPLRSCEGRAVVAIERLGKRIVFVLEGDFFLVLHLMVAGRLQWKSDPAARPQGRIGLAAFQFAAGSLLLNEAGKRKRASLHVVGSRADLSAHDRGGIDVLASTLEGFQDAMRREVHTLKRSLTDPRILSGIGNAYSDEILWHARLSPFRRTDKLTAEEWQRLHSSCKSVLEEWLERMRERRGAAWPKRVTAFQPEMAVHGKHREACPRCGQEVQRIVWAENESNYCAECQTGGKLLADRALSRLLREDWPKSLEELESLRERHRDVIDGEGS